MQVKTLFFFFCCLNQNPAGTMQRYKVPWGVSLPHRSSRSLLRCHPSDGHAWTADVSSMPVVAAPHSHFRDLLVPDSLPLPSKCRFQRDKCSVCLPRWRPSIWSMLMLNADGCEKQGWCHRGRSRVSRGKERKPCENWENFGNVLKAELMRGCSSFISAGVIMYHGGKPQTGGNLHVAYRSRSIQHGREDKLRIHTAGHILLTGKGREK